MWHQIWYSHPPVGVYIAVLALLGVIVPLTREKVGPREKALWTIVMFMLLLLELRSIYLDRAEHEQEQLQARNEQLASFSKVAQGIDKTIENSDREFAATMERTDSLLANVTGGGSFAVVYPLINPGRKDLPLYIENRGDNILTGVTVDINTQGAFTPGSQDILMRNASGRLTVGTLHPHETLLLNQYIKSEELHVQGEDFAYFWLWINQQNFTGEEYLQLRRGTTKDKPWAYKFTLYRMGRPKRISKAKLAAGPNIKLAESDWSDVDDAPVKKP